MYENRQQPLAPFSRFLLRLGKNLGYGMILIAIALVIGMLGYHFLEKMTWVDAFVNAAMILSGMGPMGPLSTTVGKIFAGCYALFSGLNFILITSLVFAPVFHRVMHSFHITDDDSRNS